MLLISGIIFILSPLLIYISYKSKRTVDLQYMDMRVGKNGKPFKCLKFRSWL
ncbi:sugar transferase [Klebsiella pneumoniae]|uniref:sugar transferase n=1 Tax=Klebsiella pneumoniae TaxID=573 RepID=UPI0022342742|nr:sugar transferase [Klebsiella pneumoniae]